jgi:predicted MFS family arabinose efflux permease
MLTLSLFKVRNFSVGNVATAAIYGGLAIATFLIVIFLQQVSGYSAFHAGLALLPVTIIMFLLSPRFGALAGRFGPRFFMTVGPLVATAGFLLMLRVQPHVSYLTQLLPGVLFFALGLSATVAPLTSAVLGGVDTAHAGEASAVNNAIARVAGLITVAIVGVVIGGQLDVHGFRRAIVGTAILVAVGGVISFLGIRNATSVTSHRAARATTTS